MGEYASQPYEHRGGWVTRAPGPHNESEHGAGDKDPHISFDGREW